MTYNVFVTLQGDDRIARFSMDPDTGALERREDVALAGGPAPVAISPDQRFMHVAQRSSKQLTSFRIGIKDGSLAPLGACAAAFLVLNGTKRARSRHSATRPITAAAATTTTTTTTT